MSSLCRRNDNDHDHPRPPSSTPPLGGSSKLIALIALLFASVAAQPVYANDNTTGVITKPGETRIVEWDLPVQMDARPGAIAIELQGHQNNNVWFVTRVAASRVYRLSMPRDMKIGNAQWKSWSLSELFLGAPGGIKKIKASQDRRFVFVRTITALQRVDTTATANQITVYEDPLPSLVSDVSVDNINRVYFAPAGAIKRVNGGTPACYNGVCPEAEVVVWEVGGGVGICQGGAETDPCLSGLAVNPRAQHLLYYSDPEGNYIGELDTNSKSCNCATPQSKTRRWNLPAGVTSPRQLNIDSDGLVWVVTGSGHLVSLNPKTNRMTTHKIPVAFANDPFGVAPDGGMIGYTDNDIGGPDPEAHKVAMLIPKGQGMNCSPNEIWVPRRTEMIPTQSATSTVNSGAVRPIPRKVPTRITSKLDGTFVEAIINENKDLNTRSSRAPLGITPDFDRATGAFFFAVGEAETMLVNRIGHARLTQDREKGKHHRDDEDHDDDGKRHGEDDDDDDDGMHNDIDNDDDNDGHMDIDDDDHDNDGIKNEHDTKTGKEDLYNYRSQLAASQFEEFQVTTLPNSLALIVTAIADDPLSPISLELRNAAGQVVGTSVAAPGAGLITMSAPAAGTYIVKVKNQASSAAGISTSIVTRVPHLVP